MLLLTLLSLSTAEARSACKALKPSQPADDAMMSLVNGAIDSAKLYLSSGSADVSRGEVSQLQDDDLAKAWFIYQICTLKEAELLSQEKAEELVELVLVGGATPAAPAAVTPAAPAAQGGRPAAATAPQRADRTGGSRQTPSRQPRSKAEGSAPDPARRAFVMANRNSLPNLNDWLPYYSTVQACGSGTTTLTVAADGTITAQGGAAACIQGVAEGLSWSSGTYTLVVP
jgi:hypothetical protein